MLTLLDFAPQPSPTSRRARTVTDSTQRSPNATARRRSGPEIERSNTATSTVTGAASTTAGRADSADGGGRLGGDARSTCWPTTPNGWWRQVHRLGTIRRTAPWGCRRQPGATPAWPTSRTRAIATNPAARGIPSIHLTPAARRRRCRCRLTRRRQPGGGDARRVGGRTRSDGDRGWPRHGRRRGDEDDRFGDGPGERDGTVAGDDLSLSYRRPRLLQLGLRSRTRHGTLSRAATRRRCRDGDVSRRRSDGGRRSATVTRTRAANLSILATHGSDGGTKTIDSATEPATGRAVGGHLSLS